MKHLYNFKPSVRFNSTAAALKIEDDLEIAAIRGAAQASMLSLCNQECMVEIQLDFDAVANGSGMFREIVRPAQKDADNSDKIFRNLCAEAAQWLATSGSDVDIECFATSMSRSQRLGVYSEKVDIHVLATTAMKFTIDSWEIITKEATRARSEFGRFFLNENDDHDGQEMTLS